MGQESRIGVDLREFPGLMTQVEPHDTPPGAASEQVNAQSARDGSLVVRGGVKAVTFEED